MRRTRGVFVKILGVKLIDNKMPFVNIKKQYLAIGMLVFVLLFLFNSRPVFQCQFNPEVTSYLPVIYGITPTYSRLAQKADLTRYKLFIVIRLPLIWSLSYLICLAKVFGNRAYKADNHFNWEIDGYTMIP